VKAWQQKVSAILIGLLLIVLIEGLLLLVGVHPFADQDRFVGFSGSSPLFQPVEETGQASIYQLNPAKEDYFNRQSFLMPKPQGTFRLATLGGSTTYGRPYIGETAFSRWLAVLGNNFDGSGKYEVINAGGISYASYRVARVQQELSNYKPDLFVVYSGHNEFLEARTFANLKAESPLLRRSRELLHYSRIYSLLSRALAKLTDNAEKGRTVLPEEVSVELEKIVGPDFYHRDENFRRGVLQQYRASLQRMIDTAKAGRVPLILCTLPSNLSGVSPFKSEHRTGLSANELTAWRRLFRSGNRALAQGDASAAQRFYTDALQIDDRYALLHFRLGQALLATGDFPLAYQAFVRAKQEDIIPLRALEEINAIVRELAGSNGVPLADVEAMFRRVASNGIPGAELFDDHVHPNIRGQQLIAWVVFDTLVKADLIPLKIAQWQADAKSARQLLLEQEQDIPARYHALGVWGVGRLYFWAGKYPEAYMALKQAWEQLKDIPEIPLKLGALEVFRGDGKSAVPLLEAALRLDPENPNIPVMLANAYLLLHQGEQALAVLNKLPAGRERSVGFLSAQGRVLIATGDYAAGLKVLKGALALAPETPRSLREYAEGLAAAGEMDLAKATFLNYLKSTHSPDPEGDLQLWVLQGGWKNPRAWLSRELELQ
jgi:tetratricopeptide (TPR) repeat protein